MFMIRTLRSAQLPSGNIRRLPRAFRISTSVPSSVPPQLHHPPQRTSFSKRLTGTAATLMRQTTLTAGNGTMKGKKRPLALADGDEINLMSPSLPLTKEVFDAMRTRIIELEDELAQQEQRPAKRARTSGGAAEPQALASTSTVPSAAVTKAEEKKRKAQVKKVFDRLKKQCKSNDVKFQGTPKTIKFDEVYSVEEFDALFSGKGALVQPTPENKPKSAVTIIHFHTQAHVEEFFGTELKALSGNVWSRGGIAFSKSQKIQSCEVTICSFEVSYSKNNMKASLKFEVEQVGGGDICVGGRGYGWVFAGI